MIPLTFLVQPEPGESGAASGLPRAENPSAVGVSEAGAGLCEDNSADETCLKCGFSPLSVGFVNINKT